jgi:hypothetical protein
VLRRRGEQERALPGVVWLDRRCQRRRFQVAALLQLINTGEVQAAETLFLASSLLITLWAFGLGILLWRAAEAGPSTDTTAVAGIGGR